MVRILAVVLGLMAIGGLWSPSLAGTYTLVFTTNAAQDAILARSYTEQAIELVSGGATSVPGCTITDLGDGSKEVVCNPTATMLEVYFRDYVAVPWFQSQKQKYVNGELAELFRKYRDLPQAQQDAIKAAAGIP